MTSVALPILGLAGDQNPSAAPKGAMSEADNVVCDLPGQARPRPNTSVVYSNGAAAVRCDAVLSFNGEWLAHDTTDGWRNSVGLLTKLGTFTTGNAVAGRESQGAVARSSMYIACGVGLGKVLSPDGTTIEAGGLDIPLSPTWPDVPNYATLVAGPFSSPISVAYRAVLKRTDANGYARRSPPTPAYVVRVTGATMVNNAFVISGDGTFGWETWYFGDSGGIHRPVPMVAGDEVEFYRTKSVASATAAIPPDYYLVKTYTVTSADVAAGYIAPSGGLFDDVADDQLGRALYTNPAQGGALAAKFDPPWDPVAVANWNRCLWLGGASVPGTAELTFAGGTTLDKVTITSGTVTSGSPNITGVSSVTGLSVGMYITDLSTGPLGIAIGSINWATKILNITGAGPYSIVMDKNAIGNQTVSVGNPLYAHHWVMADNVDYVADGSSSTNARHFNADSDAGKTAVNFANAVRLATAKGLEVWESGITPPALRAFSTADTGAAVGTGSPGKVIVRRIDGDDLLVAQSVSVGVDPLPPYPAGKYWLQTTKRGRLSWSAPDEPEAWPILNYVDLGDERTDIQRIVPLRDAMLVFTTTGLYRVSGTPPGNWSVDLLDASLRLVRDEGVDVLDGTAYAFTNRGVVSVNEQGVTRIVSDGKVDEDLSYAMTESITNSARGARVMCWEFAGLVLVALPTAQTVADDNPVSGEVLCYAPKTGAWTRWPNQYWSAGASNGISGYPYVAATRADYAPLYEIRQFVDARAYDHVWASIAVTSGAGTASIVIAEAARGAWYPMAGDWLKVKTGPDEYRRVLAAVDNGSTWTLTLDSASPSPMATFDAIEGAPVLLEWLPSVLGTPTPFVFSTLREASFSFHDGPAGTVSSVTNARITFGVRHDGSQTPVELVGTPVRSTVQLRPYRFGWPRNASRRGVCFPRLGFSEIEWTPRLAGVMIAGDGVSERARR